MPRTAIKQFEVEGTGTFPLDMLRYDLSWPATSADAGEAQGPTFRRPRRIRLKSASPFAPTPERWESFGWKVVS